MRVSLNMDKLRWMTRMTRMTAGGRPMVGGMTPIIATGGGEPHICTCTE